MKKSILLVIVFLFSQSGFCQSLLISLTGDDCGKCRINLAGLLRQIDPSLPIFIVCPEQYQTDSLILAQNLEDIKGTLVFNDQYCNLIAAQSSSIAYLNINSEVSYKKSLSNLSIEDARQFNQLYKEDAQLKIQRPDFPRIESGWKLTRHSLSQTVIVDSFNQKYQYRLDSNITNRCIEAINKLQPEFYKETEKARASKSISEYFIKPKLSGYCFSNNKFYYTVNIPYIAPPNEEDIRMGNKGHVTSFVVLVRAEKGMSIDYLPIILPQERNGGNEFTFPGRSFKVLNDVTLLSFYYSGESGSTPLDGRYLAHFKILKDRVILDKQLTNQFPGIYFQKGLGFTLSPSFIACDYPWYTPEMGTQLSDMRTGKDYTYTPSYMIDYSAIDSIAFIHRLVEGKDKLPVNNIFIFNRVPDKVTCLISKVASSYYINVFNTAHDTPELISTVCLSNKISDIADYAFFAYDDKNDMISIEDKIGRVRKIPLAFLIGRK